MWLINTTTLKLEEFQVCPKDRYAILSHCWEEEELSFNEFRALRGRKKLGFWKVQKCCEQARREGLKYAWVDTCCIDKSSSSELTEAINSMFEWYKQSRICHIYMNDVTSTRARAAGSWREGLSASFKVETFRKSKWFTRAWTLQELLTPSKSSFYDRDWTFLGSKRELAPYIEQATSIDRKWLSRQYFGECSVAQRMSWAAGRQATRVEDIAYSLLGLFHISMPLLYGEGEKAFQRLQEQVISRINDESIFCWYGRLNTLSGLLAPTPDYFAYSAEFDPTLEESPRSAMSITSRGVQISCRLIPWQLNSYLMLLHCTSSRHNADFHGILLYQAEHDGHYHRVCMGSQDLLPIQNNDNDYNVRLSPSSPWRSYLFEDQASLTGRVETFQNMDGIPRTIVILWPQGSSVPWNLSGQCPDSICMDKAGCFLTLHWTCENADEQEFIFENNPFVECLKIGFDLDFHPVIIFSIPFVDQRHGDISLLPSVPLSPNMSLPSLRRTPVWWYRLRQVKHKRQRTAESRIYSNDKRKVWGFRGDRLKGLEVTVMFRYKGQKFSVVSINLGMLPREKPGNVLWACHMKVKYSRYYDSRLDGCSTLELYRDPFFPPDDCDDLRQSVLETRRSYDNLT